MKTEEIQDLARKHANQFAITHPDEDWHSHYYGFIYGFQKAQELATNDGSADVSERISKVDLEDFADQFIEDRYRTLDHTVWGNEMEADRKIFMAGMKRIYYAR
jgi:hypothetical protein